MSENDIREKLLDATEAAVALYGLSDVSTRKIADIARISDGNIYRFFPSKESMFLEAYIRNCTAMVEFSIEEIDKQLAHAKDLHFQDGARAVFDRIWPLLLADRNKCRFQNLYYRSLSFERFALPFHTEQIGLLADHLEWLFFTRADAARAIGYVVTIFYDSARQVVDGRLPNDEKTANTIFNDIFSLFYCLSKRWPFRASNP